MIDLNAFFVETEGQKRRRESDEMQRQAHLRVAQRNRNKVPTLPYTPTPDQFELDFGKKE